MNVFIATIGTRGDVQPYLALGVALQQAGHRVTVCTSTRYASAVALHGLRFGRLSDDLVALVETPEGRAAIAGAGGRLQEMGTLLRILNDSLRIQRALLRDGWHAAQEAAPDVVVYHPKMAIALHYAERLGIPAVMTLLYPALLPTRAYPNPGFPSWSFGARGAGAYNRATHRLVRGMVRAACRWLFADWRAAQGLPPQPRGTGLMRRSNGTRVPVLNAWSRHVAPDPSDWPTGGIATTGYWRLAQDAAWTLPAGLQAFLDAGPPPVYIGFGSMAGAEPARTTRTVVGALGRAGYRGVLARGWGGCRLLHGPFPIRSMCSTTPRTTPSLHARLRSCIMAGPGPPRRDSGLGAPRWSVRFSGTSGSGDSGCTTWERGRLRFRTGHLPPSGWPMPSGMPPKPRRCAGRCRRLGSSCVARTARRRPLHTSPRLPLPGACSPLPHGRPCRPPEAALPRIRPYGAIALRAR